ncbi:MAG: VWA domain-containing protein [Planctomycetota bacterium]
MQFKNCSKATALLFLSCGIVLLLGCGRAEVATKSVTGEASQAISSPVWAEGADMSLPGEKSEIGNREFNTESYDEIHENEFQEVLQVPQSTFAIDVDTASYANVRRMLKDGKSPPAGAVRLEELVNYFSYNYPEPDGEHPFSVSTQYAACPWQPNHQLLQVGLKGRSIDFGNRPGSNLVFLLDVSGSMMNGNKLPLVKTAMKLLTETLNPDDRLAIVVYAGAAGLVLDSTAVANSEQILEAIESLRAGGSTNGGQGIQLAYSVAEQHLIGNGINRVILCTDGDFNVGASSDSALVQLVESKAKTGVFLTVLGFGTGNLKDSKMEKLADHGNGNYAYIDSELEARKVLVEEAGGTLVTIAKDVKIQVDFNPRHVQAYRLLGYENRLLENRDFRDDTKDAGEIGAGHHVTAFYELIPSGVDSEFSSRSSEFVTQELAADADQQTKLTVNLRYKQPGGSQATEFQVRVPADASTFEPNEDFRFASSVLAYGMLLRGSEYAGNTNWDWVVSTAQASRGDDPRGLREEFVQLAKTAKRLKP